MKLAGEEVIYGLVFEENPEKALQTAELEIFQPLVERGTFESYLIGEQLEEYPCIEHAKSEKGRKFVRDGWNKTVAVYRESLEELQEFFENEELSDFWNIGEIHKQYHYEFHKVGEFEGPHTYLYDEAGQGIRDREHLESLFKHWANLVDENVENPFLDQDLYVIPGIVQY